MDAMGLQKPVNLKPRFKSQQPAHLLLRKLSASVTFNRDTFRCRANNVLSSGDECARDVFRQIEVDLHCTRSPLWNNDGLSTGVEADSLVVSA
jgi:hypothetical protein